MARIAGVELPEEKRIGFALTYLYGVGWARSAEILQKAGIEPSKRTKDLSEQELAALTKVVEQYPVEGSLRAEVRQDIQRLRDIGSYRGVRYAKNLPVRGQRTRTNARTRRGKRRTVGAFKKETLAKMQQTKKSESG